MAIYGIVWLHNFVLLYFLGTNSFFFQELGLLEHEDVIASISEMEEPHHYEPLSTRFLIDESPCLYLLSKTIAVADFILAILRAKTRPKQILNQAV